MSIRPIDIVTVAPKSQEASQLQHTNMRGREQAMVNADHSFHTHEQKNQQRTVEMKKSDTENYKFDAKDGNGQGYRRNDKGSKKKRPSEEKMKKRDPFTSGFDIKI